jgi:hypothetical protein
MKRILLLAVVPFLSGCGLVFVNGPPSGWQEIQDVDALETRALTQPCTSSRTLVWVDAFMGVAWVANLFAYEQTPSSQYGYTLTDEIEVGLAKTGYGVMGLAAGIGAIVGLNKTNDCRAFNARLLELRRSDAVGQASHEWLDELSPPPDLGVAAFDPVFGLPMIQSLGFRSNEATGN